MAAILRHGTRILLCHRHPAREWFPNGWDLPGGHVGPGEAPTVALARELDEELGVVVDLPAVPLFAVLRDEDTSVELGIWLIDYDGPIDNRAPEEHDELRWVAESDLVDLRLADPAYRPLLECAYRA